MTKTMDLIFHITYRAEWGQTLCVSGSIPELGQNVEAYALELRAIGEDEWEGRVSLSSSMESREISYRYILKDENGNVSRKEWRDIHTLLLEADTKDIVLYDSWVDRPIHSEFATSAFYDVFHFHPVQSGQIALMSRQSRFWVRAYAPIVESHQRLYLSGSSEWLGGWSAEEAIPLDYIGKGWWSYSCSVEHMVGDEAGGFWFKFFVADENRSNILWEKLPTDRFFRHPAQENTSVVVSSFLFEREDDYIPRFAGMVVPLFALRSEHDLGIGDFGSLLEAIDWASVLGLKVLQILPINDTTFYRDWRDSYPYNGISVEALHPIYMDVNRLPPLSDVAFQESFESKGRHLSGYSTIQYPEVARLKEDFLWAHYLEYGSETLERLDFHSYYNENRYWLEPYAVYCFLRDSYPNEAFSSWGEYAQYDEEMVQSLLSDERNRQKVRFYFYVQYLLHRQLIEVSQYAEHRGVLIKGDIPIGVAPHSCDAWSLRHLFHLEQSAGAPPDAFSEDGQNWGFPTYNWSRMSEDNMKWWRHRFERMSQYFKAIRIDHILGFFRIWEIPREQTSGLFGHFSPALPLSEVELRGYLSDVEINDLCRPCVRLEDARGLFAQALEHLISSQWLILEGDRCYLRECSQRAYDLLDENQFAGGADTISKLKRLCNEVALLEDPYQAGYYHPRIFFEKSLRYAHWSKDDQDDWNRLAWNYFYRRHNGLYKTTALHRLKPLMECTDMLFCAEDLGMIPAVVPEVLEELQILSLELERMPKQDSPYGWVSPLIFPPLSVCTTSTHDMPPLRLWWNRLSEEQKSIYIREVLSSNEDQVYEDNSIFRLIVERHLQSPSMLAILPISDWMSIDAKLHLQTPEEEQINHPENPNQHWAYRLPCRFVDMARIAPDWGRDIKNLLEKSGRC